MSDERKRHTHANSLTLVECEKCIQREDRLAFLEREIEKYLDDPGCNAPARGNAMRRLRWALQRTQ